MDRERALEILGVTSTATKDEIQKRYDVILRKFKQNKIDENGNNWDTIEAAYSELMGITYHDKAAELRKKQRAENPNPIFKALKMDEDKTRNFIYYHKWHFIIGLVAIAVLISIITSIVNRVDPNLKVILGGEIFMEDTAKLETVSKQNIPGIIESQIQVITLSEELDGQMQMAAQQKFTIEVMEGHNDIYILDEPTYLAYAAMGVFKPLNDKLDTWGITTYDKNLEVAAEDADGNKTEPKLYGIDVSNSKILRESGVLGDKLIACVFWSGSNPEKGEAFFKLILEPETK